MKNILSKLKNIADKSDSEMNYVVADLIDNAIKKIASNRKTLIIGDVHGMTDELKSLVSKASLSSGDRIIFCGDLVDKGPDSQGTVEFARSLSSNYEVILVEGNHEEKHRRHRKYEDSGQPNPLKDAEKMREISTKLKPEDVAFLNSAVPYVKLPEFSAIVVHAGIGKDIKSIPELDEYNKMSNNERKKYDLLKRLRNENIETGKMVPLDQEKTTPHRFWAESYDGRHGNVYFGHQPWNQEIPKEFPFATGLDLGAVFGGRLAGVILEEGEKPVYVTVAASKSYHSWSNED